MSHIYFTLKNDNETYYRHDTYEKITSVYSRAMKEWRNFPPSKETLDDFLDWFVKDDRYSISYLSGYIVKRHIERIELQA